MQEIVNLAYSAAGELLSQGAVADYIPELAKVCPDLLAVSVVDLEGGVYSAGDDSTPFTIQSISKLILLIAALEDAGPDAVFGKVGMEPTGDSFNSITRLETASIRPLNPLINAGAIAVTTCITGPGPEERFAKVLSLAQKLMNNPLLAFDASVYRSEAATGNRNRALAYMMCANGVFSGSIDEHLDVYFRACSIQATCREIAYFGAVLAGNGMEPTTKERLIRPEYVKMLRSLMSTCGLYNASGEFALRVGIPAKSGVGGGIVAAVPGRMGIGTFCPRLDEHGNSCCGLRALEVLSRELGLSIY